MLFVSKLIQIPLETELKINEKQFPLILEQFYSLIDEGLSDEESSLAQSKFSFHSENVLRMF